MKQTKREEVNFVKYLYWSIMEKVQWEQLIVVAAELWGFLFSSQESKVNNNNIINNLINNTERTRHHPEITNNNRLYSKKEGYN